MSINLNVEDFQNCLLEDDKSVITTVTNYGYLLYTLNMLKSLKQFSLDKKVFIICIDKKSANILKKMGYVVYCLDNNELIKFSPWNSKGYDKICYLKLELIFRILSLNKNILLIDGDIVFLRNPYDEIMKWSKDNIFDVWIQNDSQKNYSTKNMCTGYMYIKTSERLIELYDCVSDKGREKYLICAFDNNDQSYFNKFVKPCCIFTPLQLEYYPNGKMFYENSTELKEKAILVHFNWVQGHIKMAKMKEYKMWLLTPEEEEI